MYKLLCVVLIGLTLWVTGCNTATVATEPPEIGMLKRGGWNLLRNEGTVESQLGILAGTMGQIKWESETPEGLPPYVKGVKVTVTQVKDGVTKTGVLRWLVNTDTGTSELGDIVIEGKKCEEGFMRVMKLAIFSCD